MRFIDLFWWFLDGDKSSREIIAEKKKSQQQHNEPEAFIDNVDGESDEFFEFGDFDDLKPQ